MLSNLSGISAGATTLHKMCSTNAGPLNLRKDQQPMHHCNHTARPAQSGCSAVHHDNLLQLPGVTLLVTSCHTCMAFVCRQVTAAPRKLKVHLPDIVTMLQDIAGDPEAWLGRPLGATGAAWLCFREVVCCSCSFIHAHSFCWHAVAVLAPFWCAALAVSFSSHTRCNQTACHFVVTRLCTFTIISYSMANGKPTHGGSLHSAFLRCCYTWQ